MVAKKIKAMKDNISPGVDGIPPKLLMETAERIILRMTQKCLVRLTMMVIKNIYKTI